MSSNKAQPLTNAAEIIDRFGGIRPMAAKIDTPVTTVQGWKKRDVIPGTRRQQILTAAADLNINLDDVINNTSNSNSEASASPSTSTLASPPSDAIQSEKRDNTDKKPVTMSEKPTTPKPEAQTTHDELLASMEANSKKTMVASAWIAVAMILLTAIVAFILLYPGMKKNNENIQEQSQKIEQLETKVEDVNQKTSFIQSIVPDDINETVQSLKEQATTIQSDIKNLSNQAGQISQDVLGKDAGPLSKRLSVIEEQIAVMSGSTPNADGNFSALINRIEQLENSVSGQNQLKDSMTQLQDIVANLDTKQQSLSEDLENVQENDSEGALGQTLEGVSNTDLKAAAMLIAFSQMRSALNRSEPFENDLGILHKLAGEDNEELRDAIERLAPHAENGVLTKQGLSEELKTLTGDIVFSSLQGEDVSIKEKAMARLNQVLKVEKDGQQITGTETQVTVSKAQALLDQGDIQGAIAELQTLDGEAAETAQPFLQKAEASLLAQQVENMIGTDILSAITSQIPAAALPEGLGTSSDGRPELPSISAPAGMGDIINDLGGKAEGIEDVIPLDMSREVIEDEESGVKILPRQKGFKGFSTGQ